jgi:hypothetical protein
MDRKDMPMIAEKRRRMMLKKLGIFLVACASVFLISSMAMAVPYSIGFDADGLGTGTLVSETIWGWDFEAIAKNQIGSNNYELITHQLLGNDDILNNNDEFYEDITVNVSNGLSSPSTGYQALWANVVSFISGYYNSASANIFVDIHMEGYITNYSNGIDGLDTTASNLLAIRDDSYTSIFDDGYATMYIDNNNNFTYDAGDIQLMTLDFYDADDFKLNPGIFSNGQSTIAFSFLVDYLNPSYFNDTLGLVDDGFVFTVAQGGVALGTQPNIAGDTSTTPDQILLGFQETGFDAKFNAVPEPSTIFLLGLGMVGLAATGKAKLFRKG